MAMAYVEWRGIIVLHDVSSTDLVNIGMDARLVEQSTGHGIVYTEEGESQIETEVCCKHQCRKMSPY